MMEPFIARIAEDKLGIRLHKADWTGEHPSEPWMKSHFDYVKEIKGGYIPYEIKNYNLNRMSKFEQNPLVMPDSDMGQLIQEAICVNSSQAVLCVLFGGQYFRHYEVVVTDEMKEDLTKRMAVYWGHVVAGTTPEPQTIEECKLLYSQAQEGIVVANRQLEEVAKALKTTKEQIKQLEQQEDELAKFVLRALGNNTTLVSVDNSVLATWNQSKPSKRFDAKLFQQSMPDLYEKFCIEQPGSRRFLVK